MELNKCSRCGAFYATSNNVCPNCESKDNFEQNQLKDFLQENQVPSSLETLSNYTGISIKNLNRFLSNGNYNISL